MGRWKGAVVAAAAIALVAPATAASAGGYGGGGEVQTVADGLSGPRQLNSYVDGKLVVAESDSGEVSSVDPRTGRVRTLLSGLPGPQGVDYDDGLLFVALGEAPPDGPGPEATAAARPQVRGSSLIVAKPGGRVVKSYDLLKYELAKNPDGQQQFADDGVTPLDALSNPFAVHVQSKRVLVADAGANAVLSVNRHTGRISTFFVPPRVSPREVPGCAGANEAQGVKGCDPVPTGVTEGKNGLIYVSTLGAEVPGAARVYVLTQTGKVVRVIKNLTGVTGIAVDSWGAVHVSELFEGAPEGEGPPPPDFDPSTIGQVVRIAPNGARTYAQVTMPTGLEFRSGKLYASAWSVAGFFGMPDAGEVVKVPAGAFRR